MNARAREFASTLTSWSSFKWQSSSHSRHCRSRFREVALAKTMSSSSSSSGVLSSVLCQAAKQSIDSDELEQRINLTRLLKRDATTQRRRDKPAAFPCRGAFCCASLRARGEGAHMTCRRKTTTARRIDACLEKWPARTTAHEQKNNQRKREREKRSFLFLTVE